MTGAGPHGGTSPLFGGPDMSGVNDLDEFIVYDEDDDTIAANSLLHRNLDLPLSSTKEQTLDVFSSQVLPDPNNPPPTAGAAESPDSLIDSFRDSFSESGSNKSKRRTPGSTPASGALTGGDVTMTETFENSHDWHQSLAGGPANPNPTQIKTIPSHLNMSPSPPAENGFPAANDDSFMDESFDFDSASGSPQGGGANDMPSGAPNTPSPAMPIFQGAGGSVQDTPTQRNPHAQDGRRNSSKVPLAQSMDGLHMSASRDVSPLTNTHSHHQPSPAALFSNTASPSNTPLDFSNHTAPFQPISGNSFWPSHTIEGLPAMPPSIPMMQQFPPQFMVQNPHLMQQLAYFAQQQQPLGGQPFWCRLMLLGIPRKSRVETQIHVNMMLFGAPPGIKRIHLPTHTISKAKLLTKPPPDPTPDTLELYVRLICTSAVHREEDRRNALERAAQAPHPPRQDPASGDNQAVGEKIQDGGEVRICQGCIIRERKRAGRKKIKKVEEEEMWKKDESRRIIVFNASEIKDLQPLDAAAATKVVSEAKKVAPADGGEMPDPTSLVGALHAETPMRIACYCRHHSEKMGFHVIFTLKDFQRRVVAQAMTPSIMITDDHKTPSLPQTVQVGPSAPQPTNPSTSTTPLNTDLSVTSPTRASLDGGSRTPGGTFFRPSHSTSDLQGLKGQQAAQRNMAAAGTGAGTIPTGPALSMSRPASPSSGMPPASKKRKASGQRVPVGMAMTPLDASPPGTGTQANVPVGPNGAAPSAPTSPFAPNAIHDGTQSQHQQLDGIFGQHGLGATPTGPNPLAGFVPQGPTTPNGFPDPAGLFANANHPGGIDNGMSMFRFSAPNSAHPSRAPSPNALRQGMVAQPLPPNSLVQNAPNGLSSYSLADGTNQSAAPLPTIHKIIPGEGPKMGGIEVTILGANFFQGLDVYFGDNRATTTTFWGSASLVCLLPPTDQARVVPVTLKQSGGAGVQPVTLGPNPSNPPKLFRYVDDEEAQLTKMILSMISQKVAGRMLDVRDLAQRMVDGETSMGNGSGSSNGGGSSTGGATSFSMTTETQLLKCLEIIEMDTGPRKAQLDLRRSATGQAMLHLGCSLGYHNFVRSLLARRANPDLRDKGGFTPMHMAAINGHEAIVRTLIRAGADPTLRSLSGLRPADVAASRRVIDHIRFCERHVRRRSGGSLHSRASSAASLHSLWDNTAALSLESDDAVRDGEESPEYSSGDMDLLEDEDDTDDSDDVGDNQDASWLDMRRPSTHDVYSATPKRRDSQSVAGSTRTMFPVRDEIPADAPDSPTTALAAAAALRDQVAAQMHQFQQAMAAAMHLPNLSQMPNLPQMPTLPRMAPLLPDYQAYLQQHPLMGRMSSLMPNVPAGLRPGSAGDDGTPKAVDSKWWDLSSFLMNNGSSGSNTAPPPAYSELFPGDDAAAVDEKQTLAIRAAAEAAADTKCSTLYDTETATETTGEASGDASGTEATSTTTTKVVAAPKALRIGRKKAITREQQQEFLRARAEKLKGVRSDKNLWFIWVPLLVCILAYMLSARFPQYFAAFWSVVLSVTGFFSRGSNASAGNGLCGTAKEALAT